MAFIGSFLGALLGVIMGYFIIGAIKNSNMDDTQEEQRTAPKNISSLSDPLSLYEKYTDDKSKLYKPIKNKVVNRIEIGTDEDTK